MSLDMLSRKPGNHIPPCHQILPRNRENTKPSFVSEVVLFLVPFGSVLVLSFPVNPCCFWFLIARRCPSCHGRVLMSFSTSRNANYTTGPYNSYDPTRWKLEGVQVLGKWQTESDQCCTLRIFWEVPEHLHATHQPNLHPPSHAPHAVPRVGPR